MILIEVAKRMAGILGEAALQATATCLKGAAVLALITLGIFLALIMREIAWAMRQENIKQMEEKKKDENNSI